MTAAMGPAVQLTGLTRRFGDKVAVDAIDLSIPAGSFFGVVGPNGAGKTTTLAMLTGLLRPDAGEVRLFGRDLWRGGRRADATALALVGVLPDGLNLPERLTGPEVLRFFGLIRGLPEQDVRERAEELLELLGLPTSGDTLVMEYSTGMRKKIGLALALLHAPRLLVLDEPLEAVDPVSAATIRAILTRFVERGGTVLLSSHVMSTVEALCTHVAVVSDGRIVASGPLERVRSGTSLDEAFARLVGASEVSLGDGLTWL